MTSKCFPNSAKQEQPWEDTGTGTDSHSVVLPSTKNRSCRPPSGCGTSCQKMPPWPSPWSLQDPDPGVCCTVHRDRACFFLAFNCTNQRGPPPPSRTRVLNSEKWAALHFTGNIRTTSFADYKNSFIWCWNAVLYI